MSKRHFHEDDEETTPEELSIFEFMERTVDLALQAHGMHGLELRETVGEIMRVAEALAQTKPGDFRKGIFDPKKIAAVDRESIIRAIAIYKAVAAEMLGMSYQQMQKRLKKYAEELGDE